MNENDPAADDVRALARQLDRMIGALAVELPGPVWDDVEFHLRTAAADLRLLADLLGAIGDPDELQGFHADAKRTIACVGIAAVLEAHREP